VNNPIQPKPSPQLKCYPII